MFKHLNIFFLTFTHFNSFFYIFFSFFYNFILVFFFSRIPRSMQHAQGHYCNSRVSVMLEIKRAFFCFSFLTGATKKTKKTPEIDMPAANSRCFQRY